MFVKIFQVSSDEGRINKVNLSSFQLKNILEFVLVWLAREEQNILTPHMFTYSCKHISRPIRARAYYFSYLLTLLLAMQ